MPSNSDFFSRVPLKFDFWILCTFIFYLASVASFIQNDSLVIVIFIFSLSLFIKRKRKFDKSFYLLIGIWILINVLSNVINSIDGFNFKRLLGVTIRFVIPYLFVKIIGPTFFDKLLKYIYIMTLVTLPFFLLQIFFPSIILELGDKLNFITADVFKDAGGWYIFTYNFTAWHPFRNSGFMWEPGAFAGILIFAITYRLIINQFTLDRYVFVFIIGVLTSVSTAGYIALGIIILSFLFYHSRKYYLLLLLLPFVIYFGYSFYKSQDFMVNKINDYKERGTDTWEVEDADITRVTRLGIAIITLEESIKWPFGYGILESDYKLKTYGNVVGPNSLASILHQWGWFGLIGYWYLLLKFYRMFGLKKRYAFILMISFSVMLFSNPFLFKYLIYSIPFYVLSFSKIESNYISKT